MMDAILDVRVKGLLYQWIEQNMEKYILRGDETFVVLVAMENSCSSSPTVLSVPWTKE